MPRAFTLPCFLELCEASQMSGELRSKVLGHWGHRTVEKTDLGRSRTCPRSQLMMTLALGIFRLSLSLLTIGQCWVPDPGVVVRTEHRDGCGGDVRLQKISAFRCTTFPSPTLVNTQPPSLSRDKGLQKWPHHSLILLTLLGHRT